MGDPFATAPVKPTTPVPFQSPDPDGDNTPGAPEVRPFDRPVVKSEGQSFGDSLTATMADPGPKSDMETRLRDLERRVIMLEAGPDPAAQAAAVESADL